MKVEARGVRRVALLAVPLVALVAAITPARHVGPGANGSQVAPVARGRVFRNSVGMTLVTLPEGVFIMGLPDAARKQEPSAEFAPHRVRLSAPVVLGQTEVTRAQYRRVMGAAADRAPKPAGLPADAERYPMTNVTWHEAVAFCLQLGRSPEERAAGRTYRLPTEAEWEYACRSGSSTPYRASGRPDVDENRAALRPVGSYTANDFGLYDMRENAWEWCADWYSPGYYRTGGGVDPRGPRWGVTRVVRGRDWLFSEFEHCLLMRDPMAPSRSSPLVGFRVVCEHRP